MYTGGGGPLCECSVECTLGVQLSGTACLTEKPLQCTLNRRLLQVVGTFYKRSKSTQSDIHFYLSSARYATSTRLSTIRQLPIITMQLRISMMQSPISVMLESNQRPVQRDRNTHSVRPALIACFNVTVQTQRASNYARVKRTETSFLKTLLWFQFIVSN